MCPTLGLHEIPRIKELIAQKHSRRRIKASALLINLPQFCQNKISKIKM